MLKNLIKYNCCPQQGSLSKKNFINNNNNNSKPILYSNTIISQSKTGGGIIRYGNFGSLLNGKSNNNQIIK